MNWPWTCRVWTKHHLVRNSCTWIWAVSSIRETSDGLCSDRSMKTVVCLFDIIGPIIPQIFPRLGRLDETTWLYLRPCFLKRNLVYMFCTSVNTVFSVCRSIPANTDSDAHVCRPYQCSITCVCELRRWLGVICVISEGHKQTSITHWWRREVQNSCWWCFADKTVTFDLSVCYKIDFLLSLVPTVRQ